MWVSKNTMILTAEELNSKQAPGVNLREVKLPTFFRSWVVGYARETRPYNASRDDEVFAMINAIAYIDESGNDETPNVIFAGYWGKVSAWHYFERKWAEVLIKYGVQRWHSRSYDWREDRINGLPLELATIIKESVIIPFGCAIVRKDWENLSESGKELLLNGESYMKPLLLAMKNVLVSSSRACSPKLHMNYIFDHTPNIRLEPAITRCFLESKDTIKRSQGGKNYIGTITQDGDSKIMLPLQASDMLAYLMLRFATNKLTQHQSDLYDVVTANQRNTLDMC